MFIRELKEPLSSLKGVGKQTSAAYASLGLNSWGDLLLLAPRYYEDRQNIVPLGLVADGSYANTFVQVISHSYFGPLGRKTLKVTVSDVSGQGDATASLLCFGRNFLAKTFRVGLRFYLYGQFNLNFRELQSSQFEMVLLNSEDSLPPEFGKLVPIYPLAGTLTQKTVRRDVNRLLAMTEEFTEELPVSINQRNSLLPINEALNYLHNPPSLKKGEQAYFTFSFIELFYLLFTNRRKSGPSAQGAFDFKLLDIQKRFLETLSFKLTKDQEEVTKEICNDLLQERAMNRLLQGDVGSGKTLIAWLSALLVVAQKKQVAFMAPTELLARQHAEQAASYLEPLGVRLAFLTGSVSAKGRKLLLEALANGEIDIIIGTHALFSTPVKFKNLSYIIIDEQHRFGVAQRIALLQKGKKVDVLMMSATPIPRTLALTVFGDLNISTIRMMPLGRKPITTYLVSNQSRNRMYASIEVEFSRGHQAYFVYPRIDDQGSSNLRDVESMYKYLSTEIYPNIKAALIHSRLSDEEKIDILRKFRARELTYLVSTSVVEVGIDVPNATCMVIEHAEHFGLSALHQLRGRVGRSSLQSYCFLVYEDKLSEEAKKRLLVMKNSNDGFYIAEQDLLIRGPGEVSGFKQSGFLKLRFASLTGDPHLLEIIRDEADAILESDEGLIKLENAPIREVLLKAPPFENLTMES
ncbi:MAG: ATP-dependent DNA helicase RecG [Candidatus Cloacimonetes bacterium]|nr:ATP-dependent DNA helicase RecG [Candidatus Cloacimonadota bacterium]